MLSFHTKRIVFAGMILNIMLFSGCALLSHESSGEGQTVYSADGQEDGRRDEDQGQGMSADGQAAETKRDIGNGYYYETLTDDVQRAMYDKMLTAMLRMGQEERFVCQDEDLLYRVFRCVLADHPELFYVTGYTYAKTIQGGEDAQISFSATYSMSEEEVQRCKDGIHDYVERCLSGLPQGDDYDKIRYLYEYLIRNTEYDLQAPENQNISSVFLSGRSVCQGYAKAFQYLCREAGVEAALVMGRITESGYGHAWNLVRSNGAYYYVDTTWGDASYTMDGREAVRGLPDVNYEYLCVTTEQIARTHEIDESVADMPHCTATDDNYYVREHAFFNAFDEGALDAFFAEHGGGYVTFRCETPDVYSSYHAYLIGQEHIFDYMDSDIGISYSDNEETLTFSFWLPHDE